MSDPPADKRRFTERQRAALYLAADGCCSICGTVLGPGWHADHMVAFSRGGATDVINGQALCIPCNLKKGAATTMESRSWQFAAMDHYGETALRQDYLISATPGSGKTHLAREIAHDLLSEGRIQRVIVVAPTDALRDQWAQSSHLDLIPARSANDLYKTDYQGFVVTYQQVGGGGAMPDLLRRVCGQTPTLVIFDELHHAGDGTAWGTGLTHAFTPATRRIALTGTPWRQDRKTPIPFVTYDDNGIVVPDFTYGYGQAISDQVCRPIAFHAYDCDAKWAHNRVTVTGRLAGDLKDDDVHVAIRSALLPDGPWIRSVLRLAAFELDGLRQELSPDAACLVIAETQEKAKAYAKIWAQLTGDKPTVVISEDKTAKQQIDDFRDAPAAKCIVAVKMVSEGIDIPRLAVGVYATPILTPLFFRQVVGRFVRRRPDEEHNATLFLPAAEKLLVFAREIEDEMQHALDLDRKVRDGEGPGQNWELRIPLSSSDAEFNTAILAGQQYANEDVEKGLAACLKHRIPAKHALQVAALLRDANPLQEGVRIRIDPPRRPDDEPTHKKEKRLRSEINVVAKRIAYRRRGGNGQAIREHIQALNTRILKAGFPPRNECSIAELTAMLDMILGWDDRG